MKGNACGTHYPVPRVVKAGDVVKVLEKTSRVDIMMLLYVQVLTPRI